MRHSALLCLALLLPVLAWADVSRDDAARMAQQQTGGGRVLSVDDKSGGYRVKVLKNSGEIVILWIANDTAPTPRGEPDQNGRGNPHGKKFRPPQDGF
ncbi:hypothetical protein [Leeia oryzae]|uniref:hypothetical protein n=1 Tax=Leeia oryzae TaxID=356662 RepID=UPI00037527F2|nr:hypothetical protein [Leeia oryzae]